MRVHGKLVRLPELTSDRVGVERRRVALREGATEVDILLVLKLHANNDQSTRRVLRMQRRHCSPLDLVGVFLSQLDLDLVL